MRAAGRSHRRDAGGDWFDCFGRYPKSRTYGRQAHSRFRRGFVLRDPVPSRRYIPLLECFPDPIADIRLSADVLGTVLSWENLDRGNDWFADILLHGFQKRTMSVTEKWGQTSEAYALDDERPA